MVDLFNKTMDIPTRTYEVYGFDAFKFKVRPVKYLWFVYVRAPFHLMDLSYKQHCSLDAPAPFLTPKPSSQNHHRHRSRPTTTGARRAWTPSSS